MAPITALRRTALGLALPLCLALTSSLLANEPAAPAAEEESTHAKALRYTRALEETPDAADAAEVRRALLDWGMNNGEFEVNLCNVMDLPELGHKDRSPITTELTQQMLFGNIAFQIEHGTDTPELARQVAAAESAIKVYTVMLAKHPELRIAQMDALIAEQKAGRLDRHLTPVVTDCLAARRTRVNQSPDEVPLLGGFLRETSVIYPERIGTWVMVGEHRIDTVPYGASLRYQRPDDSSGFIDLYIYPVGMNTPEAVAEQAKIEREALQQNWAPQLVDPPMSALSTFKLPVEPAKPSPYHQPRPKTVTAYQVDFGFKREDGAYSGAFIYMVDRLHGIEIRYNAKASSLDRTRLRKEAEKFTREVFPQLSIVSNGSCGLPQMGIDGKLADGCDGIEPVTPAVGEGKRELRFEYTPSPDTAQ
ncbi:hypothetical protein [Stenotrophomonas sp. PS02289]|uniref:hypothetical protein n=1 Tax=Stenotrophomonas sp. PS02289 TaxID=2991422 RepID=UPI00249C64C8|nr:hypothetical protein [Stenotrophomonas sp. PS02289]